MKKRRGKRQGAGGKTPWASAFRFPLSASRSAFTLVELLTIIAIIVLLAGMILGTATYMNRKALEAKTKSQLHQIGLALEMFKADNGVYPISPWNWPKASSNGNYHVYYGAAPYLYSTSSTVTNSAMWISNSLSLFVSLTGRSPTNGLPYAGGGKNYYLEIKPEQIQSVTITDSSTTNTFYLMVDPYGNPWGYFNTTNCITPSDCPNCLVTNCNGCWTCNQYNRRSFDLWSFGPNASDLTNSVIVNYGSQQ